jgi:hypothetical protein
VVPVLDDEREGRSECPAVAQARKDFDPVLLDSLAWTASVALLAAGEAGVDRLSV